MKICATSFTPGSAFTFETRLSGRRERVRSDAPDWKSPKSERPTWISSSAVFLHARGDREQRDDQPDADRDPGDGEAGANLPPQQVLQDQPRPGHGSYPLPSGDAPGRPVGGVPAVAPTMEGEPILPTGRRSPATSRRHGRTRLQTSTRKGLDGHKEATTDDREVHARAGGQAAPHAQARAEGGGGGGSAHRKGFRVHAAPPPDDEPPARAATGIHVPRVVPWVYRSVHGAPRGKVDRRPSLRIRLRPPRLSTSRAGSRGSSS